MMISKDSYTERVSTQSSILSEAPSVTPSSKSSGRTLEDYVETYVIIPPDGGWGWMVVLGSFISNFVADGIIFTFGVFLEDISKTFKVDVTEVALANSLMSGFYYLSGPFTCALVNRFGFQITGVMGGILAGCACVFGTLIKSLTPFLLVYGVFGGCALGLIYVPSVVAVGFYFERYRALATAIAVTGSAAGIIGFPLITERLLHGYSWQAKFRVISGLCFAAALVALLYRPLKPTRVLTNRDKTVVEVLSSIHKDENLADGTKHGFFRKVIRRFHNTKYPTQAQLCHDSTVLMYFPAGPSTSSIFINSVPGESATTFMNAATSRSMFDQKASKLDKLSTVYEDEDSGRKNCCNKFCCRFKCCKWCCPIQYQNRPMYRDDILYGASLFAISTYHQSKVSQSKVKSMTSGVEYTMSVTRTERRDRSTGETMHCKCCPESVIRILATMLSCQLLQSVSFVFLLVSGFFTVLGIYTVFAFLMARAEELNISADKSVYFFTAVGASNAVGRLLSGAVSLIPNVNNLMISYISIIIAGASTIVSCFVKTPIGQIVYCSVFGLMMASFASLRTPIVVELVGLDKLTNAFGLVLLFHGVAGLLGLPISGQIVKLTGSVNNSFLFAGISMLFSGILLIPIKYILQREKRKNLEIAENS